MQRARNLVIVPTQHHFRMKWRGSDPHCDFESCLFKLLLHREQVRLDVHRSSRRRSKSTGDDLFRASLDPDNRVEHGAASPSTLPSGYEPRRAFVEHLRDDHRTAYLSEIDQPRARS